MLVASQVASTSGVSGALVSPGRVEEDTGGQMWVIHVVFVCVRERGCVCVCVNGYVCECGGLGGGLAG